MTLIRYEILLAFLVICSERLPRKKSGERLIYQSRLTELKRGIFWPITIGSWVYHQRVENFLHFAGYLWAGLITSWCFRNVWFVVNRQQWKHGDVIYLITLETLMCFLTICISMLPLNRAEIKGKKFFLSENQRILLRAVFWMITIPRWFLKGDWRIVENYIVAMWLLVTLGWLFSDFNDALSQMGGALTRVF